MMNKLIIRQAYIRQLKNREINTASLDFQSGHQKRC